MKIFKNKELKHLYEKIKCILDSIEILDIFLNDETPCNKNCLEKVEANLSSAGFLINEFVRDFRLRNLNYNKIKKEILDLIIHWYAGQILFVIKFCNPLYKSNMSVSITWQYKNFIKNLCNNYNYIDGYFVKVR